MKIGERVHFTAAVVRRMRCDAYYNFPMTVLEIKGPLVKVDTHGMMLNEEGSGIRWIPRKNLSRVVVDDATLLDPLTDITGLPKRPTPGLVELAT